MFKYITISNLQAEVGYLLIDALQLQSYEKVLDLGCGIGNLTIELACRCNQGFVLGIDASSTMISQAKTRATGISNIQFYVLDATHIQFQKEFDVVFSNSTLHWIPEGKGILTAISAALKPGGRMGLQFPLLNERHPLIAYARQVIHSLDYERYYRGWKFPWLVTTAHHYNVLLQSAGYQNTTAKEMQTAFRFETASQAYDFFDVVGLKLFLAPLGVAQAQRFKQRLFQELEQADKGEGMLLHFERLFALGSVVM